MTVTGTLEGGVAFTDRHCGDRLGRRRYRDGGRRTSPRWSDFTLTIAAGSPTGTATFDRSIRPTTHVAEGDETVTVSGTASGLDRRRGEL